MSNILFGNFRQCENIKLFCSLDTAFDAFPYVDDTMTYYTSGGMGIYMWSSLYPSSRCLYYKTVNPAIASIFPHDCSAITPKKALRINDDSILTEIKGYWFEGAGATSTLHENIGYFNFNIDWVYNNGVGKVYGEYFHNDADGFNAYGYIYAGHVPTDPDDPSFYMNVTSYNPSGSLCYLCCLNSSGKYLIALPRLKHTGVKVTSIMYDITSYV